MRKKGRLLEASGGLFKKETACNTEGGSAREGDEL